MLGTGDTEKIRLDPWSSVNEKKQKSTVTVHVKSPVLEKCIDCFQRLEKGNLNHMGWTWGLDSRENISPKWTEWKQEVSKLSTPTPTIFLSFVSHLSICYSTGIIFFYFICDGFLLQNLMFDFYFDYSVQTSYTIIFYFITMTHSLFSPSFIPKNYFHILFSNLLLWISSSSEAPF